MLFALIPHFLPSFEHLDWSSVNTNKMSMLLTMSQIRLKKNTNALRAATLFNVKLLYFRFSILLECPWNHFSWCHFVHKKSLFLLQIWQRILLHQFGTIDSFFDQLDSSFGSSKLLHSIPSFAIQGK